MGTSWDDFIALNADDGHTYYTETGELAAKDVPHVGFGPITDVLIDGVILDGAAQAVRFLSRTSLIDRVIVRNVIGSYTSFGFFMDPFWVHGGNYGNILIENVDVRALPPNFDYMPNFLFALGGHHRRLTLRNIYNHQACDNRRVIFVFDDAQIDTLRLDGYYVTEGEETPPGASQILINGHIDRLIVQNVDVRRPAGAAPAGTLIEVSAVNAPPGINHLLLDTITADRLDSLVHLRDGAITLLQADNIACRNCGQSLVRVEHGALGAVTSGQLHGAPMLDTGIPPMPT